MSEDLNTNILNALENVSERSIAYCRNVAANIFYDNELLFSTYNDDLQKVISALKIHSKSCLSLNMTYAGQTIILSPETQARNMLNILVNKDAKHTVDWYHKVCDTRIADINIVTQVHGLNVPEPVYFSNGVQIIPLSYLSDSQHKRALLSRLYTFSSNIADLFSSFAIIPINNVEAIADLENTLGSNLFTEKVEIIRWTISGLTLSSSFMPVTGISWVDFFDPDLNAASHGLTWRNATYDGRQPENMTKITLEALQWVERFLALEGKIASKCNVALGRLNLARRRRLPGDRNCSPPLETDRSLAA